jgi:hypothetical protein
VAAGLDPLDPADDGVSDTTTDTSSVDTGHTGGGTPTLTDDTDDTVPSDDEPSEEATSKACGCAAAPRSLGLLGLLLPLVGLRRRGSRRR